MRGDALQIQEVIDNLVDNAFHYAGRGHAVTVSLEIDEDEVILAVEDDGPGVDDVFLDQLGERFFRVPGVDEDGTGLGLGDRGKHRGTARGTGALPPRRLRRPARGTAFSCDGAVALPPSRPGKPPETTP